jgi:parallel beta-helix repeat protein
MCKKGDRVIYILMLLLTIITLPLYALVDPVEGENLWRLVSRIGITEDDTLSTLDIITSELDQLISISEDILTITSVLPSLVASTTEQLSEQLNSISDLLSSEIEVVQELVESTIEIIESLQPVLLSVSDVIESELDDISTVIASNQDVLVSLIDTVETVLSSEIDTMAECVVGTPIFQSDIPYMITQSGFYTLCEDVSLFEGPGVAILITANDVTLNLAGNSITVGNDQAGIVIGSEGMVSNVTVFDGFIVGDDSLSVPCIDIFFAQNILLENIITNNGPTTHILLEDGSVNIELRGCSCIGTNGFVIDPNGAAIDLFSFFGGLVSDILIRDCVISNVLNNGIRADCMEAEIGCVSDITISNTVISNIPGTGILMSNSAQDIFCDQCQVTNGFIGYDLFNASSLLRNCMAQECEDIGFIVEATSEGALFVECIAQGGCFGFDLFGVDTTLKRCSAVQATQVGIQVEASAINTQILDTCAVNNDIDFVDNGTDTVVINLETVLEILCSKLETLDETLSSDIEQLTQAVESVSDAILSALDNVTELSCLTGTMITQADLLDSTYTITQPGLYTVCSDLTNAGDVIVIAANNVTLDLNGHTVTATGDGMGIYTSAQSNIHIKNGNIIAAQEAIYLDINSTSIIIENINTYNCSSNSIVAIQTNGLTIAHCVCTDANDNGEGNGLFFLYICASVVVEDCIAQGAAGFIPAGFGIIDPVDSIVLTRCIASKVFDVAFSCTIEEEGSLDNVTIDSCIATDFFTESDNIGFLAQDGVFGGFGPVFTNCIVENATNYGFAIAGLQGTVFENCTAQGDAYGFVLGTGEFVFPTIGTFVSNCIAQNNGVIGFYVQSDAGNSTLQGCRALFNLYGFYIDLDASYNTIGNGFAANNDVGINNAGANTVIVDTRSSNPSATTINPPYQLNNDADAFGSAVIVIIS